MVRSKFSLSLSSIMIVWFIVTLVFVEMRGKFHPLNKRSRVFIRMQLICGLIIVSTTLLQAAQAFPCNVSNLIQLQCYFVFSLTMIIYVFRAYYNFRLNDHSIFIHPNSDGITKRRSRSLQEVSDNSWFVRNAKKYTDIYFLKGIAIYSAIYFVVFCILVSTVSPGYWNAVWFEL